jgi:type I restriction-modification system DNA methylase subunit
MAIVSEHPFENTVIGYQPDMFRCIEAVLARVVPDAIDCGRAVVIVPEGVLFGSSKAHKRIREMLVEEQKLDAILPTEL